METAQSSTALRQIKIDILNLVMRNHPDSAIQNLLLKKTDEYESVLMGLIQQSDLMEDAEKTAVMSYPTSFFIEGPDEGLLDDFTKAINQQARSFATIALFEMKHLYTERLFTLRFALV